MGDKVVDRAKKALAPPEEQKRSKKEDYVSVGSTVLDVHMTGKRWGGITKGSIILFVGGSNSGKSWAATSTLAEAANNPNFDYYQFRYDNPEDGVRMNMVKFFGKKAARRIKPPGLNSDNTPRYSATVEECMYFLLDLCKEGEPFIYVVDSLDALTTLEELARVEAEKEVFRNKGKKKIKYDEDGNEIVQDKPKGTYGTDKAKAINRLIRVIGPEISRVGGILILISQTRANIGFGARFKPETRSGGFAPTFFSSIEIWSKKIRTLTKKVKGKDREIGTLCRMRITRSRESGHGAEVELPIYSSIGIDNTGSCIAYLIDEKKWKGKINQKTWMVESVTAPEFDYSGDGDGLIKKIEEENLEPKLKLMVQRRFEEIEAACKIHRKGRYQ